MWTADGSSPTFGPSPREALDRARRRVYPLPSVALAESEKTQPGPAGLTARLGTECSFWMDFPSTVLTPLPTASLTIRPVSFYEDWPHLQAIFQRAYTGLEPYGCRTHRELKRYLRWLYRRCPQGFFGAYDPGGQLRAWVAVDDRWVNEGGERVGAIHEIVVDPEVQGLGVGTRLMAFVMAWLAARGVRRLELWVGVTNGKARRFYERLGFRADGLSHGLWLRMTRPIEGTE